MMTTSYGRWIGNFPEFEQVVEIVRLNRTLVAMKLTGSAYVPAGTPCWTLDLDTMECIGALGDSHGTPMPSVPVKLTVIDRDHLKVQWDNVGTVVFRRDGI